MASSQKMLWHLTFWIDDISCAISPVYLSSSEQLHLDVTLARVMRM